MKDLIIDEAAIGALVNDPNGGIAVELERHAERAAEQARENVSRPFPGYPALNPPGDGNYPMMRSGAFRDSIQAYDATIDGEGLVVEVKADSRDDFTVPFGFSTNNRRGSEDDPRAFPDQSYKLIDLDALVE